jgi:hypothetical protein
MMECEKQNISKKSGLPFLNEMAAGISQGKMPNLRPPTSETGIGASIASGGFK